MAASGPKSKGKNKGGLGRMLRRGLMRAAERVDFVGVMEKLSHTPGGQPFWESFVHTPPPAPDQAALFARCTELTLAQLAAEGEPADPAEVRAAAEAISCRYDKEIHRVGAGGVNGLMNHFFEQHDIMTPFVSPDRRELAHLELLQEYRRQGLGVVYLINHSSHVDEFIAAALFNDLPLVGLPLFAAGTNMMAIKSLARMLMIASYAVERKGAGRVYLATLFNYCRAISECGCQQGIFLEAWAGGARSRDGSLRYPRRLVTLRGAIACQRDVVVQPVAISYAAVPEDLALAARQGARCWVRGMGLGKTLAQLALHPKAGLWRAMRHLYGRAYMTMPRPWLLSELKAAHAADTTGLGLDEFVALTAIRDIARSKKVMASQLTARALMRARRQPGQTLAQALAAEREDLAEYHLATFGVEPDLEDYIRDNPPEKVLSDGLATLSRRGVLGRGRDQHGLPPVKSERGLSFYATHGDRRIYSPTAKENIVVVGAGDWGFALAHLVGSRMLEEKRYLNASLTLFDPRPEVAEQMGIMRNPPGRFAEQRLPKNVFVTSDPVSAFRKASEVILATPVAQFAQQVGSLLDLAEGALSVVIATCGLLPQTLELPAQAVLRLARERGRADVAVFALVGPVSEEDLVLGREATGVLAGPPPGRDNLADLFHWPPLQALGAEDLLGAQLAGVLAPAYCLWGGYLQRVGRLRGPAQVGHFMARVSGEALALALALGGRAETFSAASPAWTATFAACGLAGPALELGRRLGKEARKKGDLSQAVQRLFRSEQEEKVEGARALADLRLAGQLARRQGLDLPILEEASRTLGGE